MKLSGMFGDCLSKQKAAVCDLTISITTGETQITTILTFLPPTRRVKYVHTNIEGIFSPVKHSASVYKHTHTHTHVLVLINKEINNAVNKNHWDQLGSKQTQ